MRRGISIAMVIVGIWTILTGIWQLFPPFNKGVEPTHVVPAFIFGILLVIHVWLNRKPIFRYFKGLGWKWIPVGLGVLIILWTGIVMPVLNVMNPD